MTAYQNFWDTEIEIRFQQLDAPQSLEKNIVPILNNSRRTGIFLNQNMAFVALMQSSKSAAIRFNISMSCCQMTVKESLSDYKSF
ncbi:MAG TPA: hypothetical protein VLZ33_07615 [Dysgonamonadaceae bacterium]|nr:hypothetical protein [Dysgonamonadaceae bacterium]